MKILVACEESQVVTIEFRKLGHEAYSCDILPPSGGHPEWHIQGDVTLLLDQKWDMIIAFPPCTFLSNAGARHLYPKHKLNVERYQKGLKAKEFFMQFYNADCPKIAIENPMPSKIYDLPEKSQVIQPYQFGHPYTKRTYLWLKGLPNLEPTNIVRPETTLMPSGSYGRSKDERHKGAFTKDRPRLRSKTAEGIAKAMAEQWGGQEMEVEIVE